jgi:DNA-binding GntR family transcriptional regulator
VKLWLLAACGGEAVTAAEVGSSRVSNLSVIRAGSLRDQVRRALEAAMVAGELVPAEMYSAPALAERFGVSATPVREAMMDLARDGFVEVVRNKGFRVVEMSEADLDQVSQIRLLLEVPTTVDAAGTLTPEDLAQLEQIATEIEAAAQRGALVDYLDADRRFHLTLLATLGNPRLTDLVDRLRRQTRLFGLEDLATAGLLAESAAEHRHLLAALRARDRRAIRRLIAAHIKHTRGLWAGKDEQLAEP